MTEDYFWGKSSKCRLLDRFFSICCHYLWLWPEPVMFLTSPEALPNELITIILQLSQFCTSKLTRQMRNYVTEIIVRRKFRVHCHVSM